jgi:hypothetical protein
MKTQMQRRAQRRLIRGMKHAAYLLADLMDELNDFDEDGLYWPEIAGRIDVIKHEMLVGADLVNNLIVELESDEKGVSE